VVSAVEVSNFTALSWYNCWLTICTQFNRESTILDNCISTSRRKKSCYAGTTAS
jgi:hypothetical protein